MAAAMGANAIGVGSLVELESVLKAARGVPGVHVIVTKVAVHQWSEGGGFWEVGVPEVSHRSAVDEARRELLEGKAHQRDLR